MKLYQLPLSGHAHRAVLFLSLLGQKVELIEVDIPNGAHRTPEYLKLNPFGQVPVLEHDDFVLTESSAILKYLADKFNLFNGVFGASDEVLGTIADTKPPLRPSFAIDVYANVK